MKNKNEDLEKRLLDMVKQKEETDKKLLIMEILIGVATIGVFLVLVAVASIVPMQEEFRLLIILPSTIFIVIMCFIMLKIEQIAGYYECKKCNHKHIPTYSSMLWAMHIGRTRYMRCPECNKKSWQKKTLTKD